MTTKTDILDLPCASCNEPITSPEDGDRATVRFNWEISGETYERTIMMCAACIVFFVDQEVDADSLQICLVAPDHILRETEGDESDCTCPVCKIGELVPETPPPRGLDFNPRDYDYGA